MAKIFISYRRDDSQYQADKLHGALKPYVANPQTDIFIDIDNIPFGVDFETHLDGKVAECDVLLALIGDSWLTARDLKTGQRRLDDPQDFVRIEIAAALKRGIPVVPVLLDGAPFPSVTELPDDLKPLAKRNGLPVSRPSFESDIARLVNGLPIDLPGKRRAKAAARTDESRLSAGVTVGILAIVGLGVTTLLFDPLGLFSEREGTSSSKPVAGTLDATSEMQIANAVDNGNGPTDLTTATIQAGEEGGSGTADALMGTSVARTDAIRKLQADLATLGYYTSIIDGAAGQGTQRAAESFAQDEGIDAPLLAETELSNLVAFAERTSQAKRAFSRRESAAWTIARAADTKAAYEAYLLDFPVGSNAGLARARIKSIQESERTEKESSASTAAISGASDSKTLQASSGPLLAIPDFNVTGSDGGSAKQIARIVRSDLASTGLFRMQSPDSFIQRDLAIDSRPRFEDWRTTQTERLVVGALDVLDDGRIAISFRLWDISDEELIRFEGTSGRRLTTDADNFERLAHKMSDSIYVAETGRLPYFESSYFARVEGSGN